MDLHLILIKSHVYNVWQWQPLSQRSVWSSRRTDRTLSRHWPDMKTVFPKVRHLGRPWARAELGCAPPWTACFSSWDPESLQYFYKMTEKVAESEDTPESCRNVQDFSINLCIEASVSSETRGMETCCFFYFSLSQTFLTSLLFCLRSCTDFLTQQKWK